MSCPGPETAAVGPTLPAVVPLACTAVAERSIAAAGPPSTASQAMAADAVKVKLVLPLVIAWVMPVQTNRLSTPVLVEPTSTSIAFVQVLPVGSFSAIRPTVLGRLYTQIQATSPSGTVPLATTACDVVSPAAG